MFTSAEKGKGKRKRFESPPPPSPFTSSGSKKKKLARHPVISVPDDLSDNDLSDSFTRPAPVASSSRSRPPRVLPLPPRTSPPSDSKDSLTEENKGDEDGEGDEEDEEEGAVSEVDEHEDGERPSDHHAFDRDYPAEENVYEGQTSGEIQAEVQNLLSSSLKKSTSSPSSSSSLSAQDWTELTSRMITSIHCFIRDPANAKELSAGLVKFSLKPSFDNYIRSLLNKTVTSKSMRTLVLKVHQGQIPSMEEIEKMVAADPEMVLNFADDHVGFYVHLVWSAQRKEWMIYVGVGAGKGGDCCLGSVKADQVKTFAGKAAHSLLKTSLKSSTAKRTSKGQWQGGPKLKGMAAMLCHNP